ncbi:hypothetical protein BTJ40_05760 [Microbulbifer sp. A4B17]|nr:hypothetical protein BTJ40_05760 [Microbulbifer sp. A4B17]
MKSNIFLLFYLFSSISDAVGIENPAKIINAKIVTNQLDRYISLSCQKDHKTEVFALTDHPKGYKLSIPKGTISGCLQGEYLVIEGDNRILLFFESNPQPVYRTK